MSREHRYIFLLSLYLGVELLGQGICIYSALIDIAQQWLHQFILPSALCENFCYFFSCLRLILSVLLNHSHSVQYHIMEIFCSSFNFNNSNPSLLALLPCRLTSNLNTDIFCTLLPPKRKCRNLTLASKPLTYF
jgi:hypothetical protein